MTNPQSNRHIILDLYISGSRPRSIAALINIQALCDGELKGRVELHVIDIHDHPEALCEERLLAIPTLIKRQPLPQKRIIGDLADKQRLLMALDLQSEPATGALPSP